MKKLCLAILLIAAPSLAQTVRPDQVRGTAAVASPAAGQTITQPVVSGVQTTLTVNSLNGMMNPLAFSNADFGDKVNAAFTACHGTGATVTPCTVKIPSGTYSYAHTINLTAFDTLEGSGLSDTTINFTGTGDGIKQTSTVFQGNVGSLHDFQIIGTASATNCVHISGITGPVLYNLGIHGCVGANADGLLLEDILTKDSSNNNLQSWMERIQIHNVDLGKAGADNFTDMEFRNNGGSGSFDYSDIDVTMGVHCGGNGIIVGTGTDLLQVQLSAQGNIDSGCGASENSTEALVVKGLLRYARGFIGLEGGTSTNAFHVYSTGEVLYNGTIHAWVNSKNAPPVVDSGGFWQASPFVDFGYANGATDGLSTFYPFVQRAALKVSADGTIAIASGNNMSGFIDLTWPGDNGRFQDLLLSVTCSPFGTPTCNVTTLSNQSITNPPVFTNVRIMGGTGSATPHLVVDVGNRNTLAQTIYASAWGAEPMALFPTNTVGSTLISTEGLSVNGSASGRSVTWGGGTHTQYIPNSDNLVYSPDGAIPSGTCTLAGYLNAVYNGHAIHVAACQ